MSGWGWGGYGCVGGVPCMQAHALMYTHMHTHTCTHTHMHTHTHAHTQTCTHMHVKHGKLGCLHVSGHLQFLYMYTCVCVCMCMHVNMCGDTPMPLDTLPPTCLLLRATGSPKQQNSISLVLIKIIRFCLKILYL